MNTKFLILHTIAILAFSYATAQTTLSSLANAPRNGDNIEREVMAVPSHVAAGSKCVWDFSMLEQTGERHETIYMADSADCLTSIDERCIRRNVVSPTGVYVCTDETPLYKFEYDNQLQVLRFPLCYGDSAGFAVSGGGLYCKTRRIAFTGNGTISADGYGRLVLEDGDTIDNVLLVRHIQTKDVRMDIDSVALDATDYRTERTETRMWYAPGYRYPLFEVVTSTSLCHGTPVASASVAYRYLPQQQAASLYDPVNEEIREAVAGGRYLAGASFTGGRDTDASTDGDGNGDGMAGAGILNDLDVTVSGGMVSVSYSLTESASVTALVCDASGIVYRRGESASIAGGNSMTVNCSGLRHGEYILYLNVNGQVTDSKIRL